MALLRRAGLALSLATFAVPAAAAPPQTAGEYQVKAAFLYNFAKFVDWPASALPDTSARLVLGILGEDPFGSELDATLHGKTVNGRSLEIRRLRAEDGLEGCHMLFVAASDSARLPDIVARAEPASVLTVGETEDFALKGGIIRFVTADNKVRFEINVDAAERSALRISSKLLKLCTIVRGSAAR